MTVIYLGTTLLQYSCCLPNLALHQLEFTSSSLSPAKRVCSLANGFTLIPQKNERRNTFCCTCPHIYVTTYMGRRYRLTTLPINKLIIRARYGVRTFLPAKKQSNRRFFKSLSYTINKRKNQAKRKRSVGCKSLITDRHCC